jgi:hypothetical protein
MKNLFARYHLYAIVALALGLTTAPVLALEGEEFISGIQVSLSKARRLALKTYPGKIVAEGIEKEAGGSGLRYSFEIDNGKAKHEVGIDAKTGQVLENSVESPHSD